jgi:hypothetical protein
MNRKEIETKDRLLLDKIRETVKYNEEKAAKTNGRWTQMTKIWIPVLFIGLILIALWAFKQRPATVVPKDTLSAANEIVPKSVPAVEQQTIEPQPPIESASRELAPREPEPAIPARTDTTVSAEPTAAKAQSPVSVASAPEPPEADSATDDEGKQTAAPQPADSETVAAPPGVRIAKIVACSGVSERQYVSPKDTFSLSEDIKPVVWMNVLSEKQPFVLKHVYYVNDRKYVEVPLNIRYPRNRTWSHITLSHQGQIGDWRVDVVNESGEKLDQVQFSVVP